MSVELPVGRAYAGAVMATIAWGVLAFGAVYPWAYVPLGIAAAALGLWGALATHAWADPRTRALGLALVAIGLAIGLQLVAWPYGWLEYLSPGVDAYLSRFLLGYHPASLQTLSIDPEATVDVFLRYSSLALFLVGLSHAIRYVPWTWLVNQLMGLGVGLAVIGIVQKALSDPDRPLVYGFWAPQQGGNPFGPFINRNHFAGWMVMVLPIVLAYGWALAQRARQDDEPRGGSWRWATVEGNRLTLIAFAVLAMAMSVAATASRSGVASLAIALFVIGVFMMGRAGGARQRARIALALGIVFVGALGWAGVERVAARFNRAPVELEGRFEAWRDTAQIIRDFPITGTGLGTYPQAMLVYQTSDRSWMYAEAHNDYLQLMAEGGLLVCVPVVIALGIVAWTVRRRFASGDDDPMTSWVRVGSVAGLAGIAAQSLVEFSLQMPGNAACFVLLLAIALHRPSRRLHAHRV